MPLDERIAALRIEGAERDLKSDHSVIFNKATLRIERAPIE